MTTHNRCKELSEKDLRELFAQREEITRANELHDRKYGVAHEKVGWRSFYQPCARSLEREEIWRHHRLLDEEKATQLGLKIV